MKPTYDTQAMVALMKIQESYPEKAEAIRNDLARISLIPDKKEQEFKFQRIQDEINGFVGRTVQIIRKNEKICRQSRPKINSFENLEQNILQQIFWTEEQEIAMNHLIDARNTACHPAIYQSPIIYDAVFNETTPELINNAINKMQNCVSSDEISIARESEKQRQYLITTNIKVIDKMTLSYQNPFLKTAESIAR